MTDQLIYEGRKSKVFRRDDNEGGEPIAVKVLNHEFPTPEDIQQFEKELDIMKGIALPGTRRVLGKGRENNRHVLYLEWVEGRSMKEVFHEKTEDFTDALYIAIKATEILGRVHELNIIHKDITPFNFLVDLQERDVCLIDFAISTNFDARQAYVGNPERIEGTLAYCSPEQTGRTNRILDHRSDLYSLGATFYELFSGRIPFPGSDPMEIVHGHLAQIPTPLHELNPNLPRSLSAIVAKLLAKNADDRYQSAQGLHRDLEECLKQIEAGAPTTTEFPLGKDDFFSGFRVPDKLYGREEEIETIVSAFDSCASGPSGLLLVGGSSGVGKTSLVREVYRPITAKKGYFCSGKFDQFQRATPYYAFLAALRELVDTILTEHHERLDARRERIGEALGEEGIILTNLLPNLEHIIGPQPEIPEVGGTEAQNRFHYVFRKFVRSIATAENPLAIFIDDLQWADSASLDLLHLLATDPESRHLLLICAYRSNEVDTTHPFIRTVEGIREEGGEPICLEIENLTPAHLKQLLTDALSPTREEILPLVDLIFEKTRGNAFFATEFIKSLADEKLIRFDFETRSWTWSERDIAGKNIADNVVDLMAAKAHRLVEESLSLLKVAACVGNTFDLAILSSTIEKSASEVLDLLHRALADGLVLPLKDNRYKFSHDRVQQAIYSLIPEDLRNEIHHRIGTLLLRERETEGKQANLFQTVNQLNLGSELLPTSEERIQLAELNLEAGKKAKVNTAFPTALKYFQTGMSLLAREDAMWDQYPVLARALHTEGMEAAYMSGEFEPMNRWFEEIIAHSGSIEDRLKPYEIRILAYKAENRFHEAIETGLEVLEQLGERFPARATYGHVFFHLLKTHFALRGRDGTQLMNLPLMSDPRKMAAMRIMANIMSSVYWGRPKLAPVLALRMVRLSLRYGNHPVSCFAYGSYGVILCGILGRMRSGYQYGKLALDLLEKLNAKEWKAQVYCTPYALIFHWNENVRNTLRPLQQSFQIGMETGLVEFACVNTNLYCIQAFLCGRPLERIEEETRSYSRLYQQFKQETNQHYNEVFRQAMLNLMGQSEETVRLTGTAYNEEEMLAQTADRNDETGAFFIHFNKLLLACLFREFDQAACHADETRRRLDAVIAKFEVPNQCFYETLAFIALLEEESCPHRIRRRYRVYRNLARLRKWAKYAPENYRHKYALCQAELYRLNRRGEKARLLYDKAISGASEYDFIHEQALAYELAGRFYDREQRHTLAEFYLKAAYNGYREWGAVAKMNALADSFPNHLSRGESGLSRLRKEGETSTFGTSSMIDGSVLDMNTVLKAATSISREVVPSRLLSVLMQIVLENAGAQRGFLFLESEDGLLLQAQAEEGGGSLKVMTGIPLERCDQLCTSLVQFVHRTGEPLVIADARTDSRSQSFAYVIENHPKSILCVPIRNRGVSVGVLYLENNFNYGAFTRERVDLLTLISGQISVSIENATLYENLEIKVQERTAELEAEKRKSEDLLHNILPVTTARELKETGTAKARHFERATVLFTDFKGFTSYSSDLAPEQLVQEIDECFKAFDLIVEQCGVEKIKTIGDSYMAVGGIPVPNSTHPFNVVHAALEMRDFISRRNRERPDTSMGIRIGIHTGPLVAGIVGLHKFQYDVWGDTVNTASRMESHGEIDKVNISQATYELVRDRFRCESRGAIEAKGKGHLRMYFAEPLVPLNGTSK